MHKSAKPQHPFFLTRNSANIMEDLVRRVSAGSSLSLISGVRGVGKSRFLRQFYTLYQNRFELVLVCFNEQNNLTVAGSDLVFSEQSFLTAILPNLKQGSGLIIDQLDLASPKTQHKIFKFCSDNAHDQGFSLIFSAQSDSLQQFIDFSHSCHFPVERAELSALDYSEQLEYIRAGCCTKPGDYPLMTAPLKKELAATGGVFGKLSIFIQHYNDKINCSETGLQTGFRSSSVLISVVALCLVLLTGGYLLSEQMNRSSESLSLESTVQNVIQNPLQNNSAVVKLPAGVVADSMANSPDELLIPDNGSSSDDSPDSPVSPEAPARAPSTIQVREAVAEKIPAKTRLQQRIQATLEWIASSTEGTASIQIMSLEMKNDAEVLLNRYLQNLDAENIDLNEVKIYQFSKKGRSMYAVLYGSYQSYAVAAESIDNLPVELKANGPITRTIKGINDEINFQ